MKQGIERKTNSKGIDYALCGDGQAFEVWKLCENYCPRTKGGIRKVWRYIQKDMNKDEAEKLFNRRTK